MRPSNKSRSRNKNNNNRRQNLGNVINRVFDSSGPEGRVRGTPQQIIDKYQSLASDAVLAGDRIAHENFLQHSEHYSRLLVVAQKELDAKREQQQKQNENKPPVNNAEKVDEQVDIATDQDESLLPKINKNQQVDVLENASHQKNKIHQPKKKIIDINEELPITSEEQSIDT
ncbi:DUF4167 domain-containing protein [bacterium]|nr:DUF4167 domain-containing protein [bacterium]